MFRHRHDHDSESAIVTKLTRMLPIGTAGAALVGIAAVDILFAVDSVPAILGHHR